MNPADHVELIGRLGAAPEIRAVTAGRMLVINLAVQVVSFANDENGASRSTERTKWLRVISFDPRIIGQAQGLEKDDFIAIRGYPEQRMFEKDGRRQFITEIVAEKLDPLRPDRSSRWAIDPAAVKDSRRRPPDMLRITIELLPGGREEGAIVISSGQLPALTNFVG